MRLQPGRMFLVDTAQGRIVSDEEVKAELAAEQPYQEWLDAGLFHLDDLPPGDYVRMPHHRVVLRQQAFGFTYEELNLLVAPMARSGAEALGSMGTDTPVAVLSARPRMLYDYFQQLFAQVTNPPLDAIREEVVTSLQGTVGPEGDLLNPNADSCRQIVLSNPILRNAELSKLICVDPDHEIRGHKHGLRAAVIRCLYPVARGGQGLKEALDDVRAKVSAAIRDGARIIVLSDRESNESLAPIPSLLSVSAVHHHLVRDRTRTQVGLVVEAGDAREVHHMAALCGFGAAAINPYMAFESIEDMVRPRRHHRHHQRPGQGQLHQGRRQGRAEGDVQDGHLHAGLLHRCPAVPGHRHQPAGARRLLHRAALPRRRHRPRRHRRRRRRPGTRWPTSTVPTSARTASSRSAASTSGAARASTTCSTPTPCSSCSTPPAPVSTRSSRSTPSWSTTRASASPRCAGCSSSAPVTTPSGRAVSIDEVEPVVGDRQAILHRRDELRLDLGRGARDAGHRDEPPWRPVELGRGRREPSTASTTTRTATGAAVPSSRWPRAASA